MRIAAPKLNYTAALSAEAKATIRELMGAEAEAMIAAHELAEQPTLNYQEIDRVELSGKSVDPADHLEQLLAKESGARLAAEGATLLQAIPEVNSRARLQVAEKLLEALEKDEKVGPIARLGLAGLGKIEASYQQAPYDSLLERSVNDFKPGPHLLPVALKALQIASVTEGNPKPSALAAAGREMADSTTFGEPPMAKLYTGLRLALAVAQEMGEVRVVGRDALASQPLNLVRQASSDMLARAFYGQVDQSFKALEQAATRVEERQLREMRRLAGQVPLADGLDVDLEVDRILVGDTELEINWNL